MHNLIHVGYGTWVRWSWILFQFHNETEVPNFLPNGWELLGTQWLVGGLGWWSKLALGTFAESLIFIGKFPGSRQKQPPTDHSQITKVITTTLRILFQDSNQPWFQDPYQPTRISKNETDGSCSKWCSKKKQTPGLWESDLSSESISAADMQRQGMNLGGMNGVGICRE